MKTFFVLSGLFAMPLFVSAQSGIEQVATTNLGNTLLVFSTLINAAIPIVLALAVLYFFWGLAQYILNSANEEKKEEGRSIMIYGIIALFVMVSIWGLIRMLQTTFSVGDQNPIIPEKIR